MTPGHLRFSTSDYLLDVAVTKAGEAGCCVPARKRLSKDALRWREPCCGMICLHANTRGRPQGTSAQ